jgi:hypothetical protein
VLWIVCQCQRHKIRGKEWDSDSVPVARERGARALEGYPMITQPGEEITWDELRVGSRSIFAAAGFAEVSRPTLRRVMMRIDF